MVNQNSFQILLKCLNYYCYIPKLLDKANLRFVIPFMFVHDLQNYVHLMSEQRAQMHELKIVNLEIWQFFQ